MEAAVELRGRERDLAQLELSIGPGNDGLRIVVLSGEAGIGKSALLECALAAAGCRGFRVAHASARMSAWLPPYSAWVSALTEVAAFTTTAGGALRDASEVATDLALTLAATTGQQPLVLAFDDAHLLDEASLALVATAIDTAAEQGLNITLVLVEQSGAAFASVSYRQLLEHLSDKHVLQRFAVRGLSCDALAALVATRTGGAAPDDVVNEIVGNAEGNPWFAAELAEAWSDGRSDVPPTIAALVDERLEKLSDDMRDATIAISLCPDGAQPEWIAQLVARHGTATTEFVEALCATGLVEQSHDGHLRTVSLMIARALVERTSCALRRALHSELANAIDVSHATDPALIRARAQHLARCGRIDNAAIAFDQAAATNLQLGRVHEALADHSLALDHEPRMAQRLTILRKCAYLAEQVRHPSAPRYWSSLVRLAEACGDHETQAYALYNQSWSTESGDLERLERAAMLGADTLGWAARAEGLLRSMRVDYEGSLHYDELALQLARSSGDEMLEALALDKIARTNAYLGRFDHAVPALEASLEYAREHHVNWWVVGCSANLSDILAETLDTEASLSAIEQAVAYVDEREIDSARAAVAAFHALALARCGRLADATRVLAAAVAHEQRMPADFAAVYRGVRAEVEIERGDVPGATAALDAAAVVISAAGDESYSFELDFMRARYAALKLEYDQAFALATTLHVDEAIAMARMANWVARTAVFAGNVEALAQARIRASSIRRTSPLTVMLLDEVEIIARCVESHDISDLENHAERWRMACRPLDAARARVVVASLLERVGEHGAAVDVYSAARADLARTGAAADIDFVDGSLRRLGTHTRAQSYTSDVANLTQRELQIARLVGAGMRNAQVAEQLHIAQKTVAAHLSNIYGKLAVTSRGQLAAWMQTHDQSALAV